MNVNKNLNKFKIVLESQAKIFLICILKNPN
jgi:hypothetical protein